MKRLPLILGLLVLVSCSGQTKSEKGVIETEESTEVVYSKLPTNKKNNELIKKLEFEKIWDSETPKQVGTFFGQNLYLYSFEYDTVVNRTPIMFLYQFIGGEDNDLVEKRMLDDMNMTVNDLIETAKTQTYKCLYSVAYDEIKIGTKLEYVRNERLYTGGAGEMFTRKFYEMDGKSVVEFLVEYDKYSSDSEFLEGKLTNTIEE